MSIDAFNLTIDQWILSLDHYDFETLCRKPSASVWSMGQVYMHLIENASFYIEQINICLASHENAYLEPATHGKYMLRQNEFPDKIIEGPPSNLITPQPDSKEHILENLTRIRHEMNDLATLMQKGAFTGKAKHPGLLYMNANEWLQFADMHLRHHFRQKTRIDLFLSDSNLQTPSQ